jgi:hypothetical protein
MNAETGGGSGVWRDVLLALGVDWMPPNAKMMPNTTAMIPLTVATSKNIGFTSSNLRPGFSKKV